MIYTVTCIAILIVMIIILVRAFCGPSIYDRILAVNMFGTKTVLLIAVYGFLIDRPEFLDLAIVYTLINFIGIVCVLNFIERVERMEDEEEHS